LSPPPDPPAAGSLDRTGYDLRLALQQPGCPVCGVTQAAVGRQLEAISYEAVNDPGARERLRASFGYCAAHGRQWWELQNTLGTAIIYRDMCNAARTIIEQAGAGGGAGGRLRALLRAAGGSDAGRALARALRPQAPCPGCRQTAESEASACVSFATALKEPSFFDAFAAHAVGLCLPHLRNVAARIGDPALVARMAQAHVARLAATEADLSEVIRKYDYRFNREPHGPEFEAPLRSIEQMGGRLPTLLNGPAAPAADS
jgi:hypothetical protein